MEDLDKKSDSEIAALAVRSNSKDLLVLGLNTLFSSNAIDDYRDIVSALVLYYDASKRLNLDPDEFFLQFAKMNPLTQEYLRGFVERTPELKTLEIGGYKVVEFPEFHYAFKFSGSC